MSFYYIVIECYYLAISAFIMMLITRFNPPKKWGEVPYCKSKLAKRMYKKLDKTIFRGRRFDMFHLASFHFFCLCSLMSTIVLIVDLSTSMSITKFIGFQTSLAILIILAILFLSYELFLGIWWSILNKDSRSVKEVKRLIKEGTIKSLRNNKKDGHR